MKPKLITSVDGPRLAAAQLAQDAPMAALLRERWPIERGMKDDHSVVYLLHFEAADLTKLHYCGVTTSRRLLARMQEHSCGGGAALTRALINKGVGFYLARLWRGEGYVREKLIKRNGHVKTACPLCSHRQLPLLARAFFFSARPTVAGFEGLSFTEQTSEARRKQQP